MSLKFYLNNRLIPVGAGIPLAEAQGNPEFEVPSGSYTIVMYDTTVNMLHYLRYQGMDLVPYLSPKRPGHTYVIDLYEGTMRPTQRVRENFMIGKGYGKLVGRTSFSTTADRSARWNNYSSSDVKYNNQWADDAKTADYPVYHGDERFVPGNPLREDQKRWCNCYLEVLGKGTAQNPPAVCAKSTGTTYRDCYKYYAWKFIPDNELIAYAEKHNISIPNPYNRDQMIQTMYNWIDSKK